MLSEFEPLTEAAKAKGLRKGEKYYYLFFVGTKEESRGKGKDLCLNILRFQIESELSILLPRSIVLSNQALSVNRCS